MSNDTDEELVLEESDYTLIPEDTVLGAEVVEVKKEKQKFKDRDTGEDVWKWRFKFCVIDPGAHEGTYVYGRTSTTFNRNPKCKLFKWAQEILAQELTAGFRIRPEGGRLRVLEGQKCRVVMAVDRYMKGDEERENNYVGDVMRSRDAMRQSTEEF